MTNISPKTVWRLQVQGLAGYRPEQLESYRYGIRFAYLACSAIVALRIFSK